MAEVTEPRIDIPLQYEVSLKMSQRCPMRDGIRLSTDLYFPKGCEKPLPCILMRTPYNKNLFRDDPKRRHIPEFFAGQGYVVAAQDKRGRYESEGEYTLAKGDGKDGYDTVEWLINQPWCDGNIGMFGCSYVGETQIYLSKCRHPNVKAMIPQAAGAAMGSLNRRYTRWGYRTGGALGLLIFVGWMAVHGSKTYARLPEMSDEQFEKLAPLFRTHPLYPEFDVKAALKHLPVVDILKKYSGLPTSYEEYIVHDYNDPWWEQFDFFDEGDRVDVPMLHINSWYDPSVAETLEFMKCFSETALSEKARQNQFAVIAPDIHCRSEYATEKTLVGDRDAGDARFCHWELYLRWYDHWLKGIKNGVTQMPKVRYYLMGKNEWRGGETWPLPGTRFTPFYLSSGGQANSLYGDGSLTPALPANDTKDAFTYDPDNPVPSLGGAMFTMGNFEAQPGALDQREVESRSDVLVYTTPPLSQGVTVAGPIKAVLYISSTATDTDFTAKLVDVYPDGRAFNLHDGIIRTRYRQGFLKNLRMTPGEVYEVTIDLEATANYFGPGHAIRLEVSSSNFPRFERNLNTGGNNYDEKDGIVAKNTVHHGGKYPSHVLLPVVEEPA